VRAAVLKQFAEKPPTATTLGKIAEYATAEKDSDLVVHAVRVFRAAKDTTAQAALVKLTNHESWRVRAEAVEALAEMTGRRSGNNTNDPEVTKAALKLLEDTDSFVASQAAIMLKQSNLASSFDAIMKAAETHPELAAAILPQIGEEDELKARALPYLTRFAAHADPAVRAAAMKGLGAAGAATAGDAIKKALKDADERVRIAAADATFAVMEDMRPKNGMIRRKKKKMLIFNGEEVEEPVDSSKWLADFRAGKDRAPWLGQAIADLEKLLESKSEQERISAALPLVALGKEEKSLPILLAKGNSSKTLSSLLPWLLIEKRLEIFKQAMAAEDEHEKAKLIYAMAQMPDPAVRKPLWDLLAGKDVSKEIVSSVQSSLLNIYLTERHWNLESLPKALVNEAIKENKERAASGSDAQRVVALSILLTASAADVPEVAEKIYRDAASSQSLREDALHVLLVASEKSQGAKLAVEALASDQPAMRSLALAYLAEDDEGLSYLRAGIYARGSVTHVYYSGQETPQVKAPAGLKEEMLLPFIQAGGKAPGKEGALAGYLLALMGKNDGMDLLIAQWRAHQAEYNQWKQRVYRAIAALNDEKYVPVLEEMYSKWDKNTSYEIREFYWTIRAMTGERILALRKKIRDEVGMSNLR
jgi:HEAT repeat protein